MVRLIAAGMALLLPTAAAFAQDRQASAPAEPAPSIGARVASDPLPEIAKVNPAAPLPGANSFTRKQAKRRLLSFGFSDVGTLAKDDNGIWRGRAVRNGRKLSVAVDFQGSIVAY
jgi:hypothetical protein